MKFADVVNKLEVGKQYTLAGMGDFGFPFAIQLKLTAVKATKFAQYDDAVQLKFIVKGKRKESLVYFYGAKALVIWEGFVNPNVEMYGAAIQGKTAGVMIRESKWMSFDKRYIQTAIESVDQVAIVDTTNNAEVIKELR